MMSRHHIWSIAGATISAGAHAVCVPIGVGAAAHGREAAAEACGTALEIAETTAWASPIPRTRAVFGWGKWREKRRCTRWLRAGSAIKHLEPCQQDFHST